MALVIRALGLEGLTHHGDFNLNEAVRRGVMVWIKSYDVDAFDGRGDVRFTDSLEDAMRFEDMNAAFNAWKSQSKVRPLRPDGKPNRPLTAFSITFDTVED